MARLRASNTGAGWFASLYRPNAAAATTAITTTAAPISNPRFRRTSAMTTARDDDGVKEGAAISTWDAAVPAVTEVDDEFSAAILPDSISRFSRLRSARISEAC